MVFSATAADMYALLCPSDFAHQLRPLGRSGSGGAQSQCRCGQPAHVCEACCMVCRSYLLVLCRVDLAEHVKLVGSAVAQLAPCRAALSASCASGSTCKRHHPAHGAADRSGACNRQRLRRMRPTTTVPHAADRAAAFSFRPLIRKRASAVRADPGAGLPGRVFDSTLAIVAVHLAPAANAASAAQRRFAPLRLVSSARSARWLVHDVPCARCEHAHARHARPAGRRTCSAYSRRRQSGASAVLRRGAARGSDRIR